MAIVYIGHKDVVVGERRGEEGSKSVKHDVKWHKNKR
jgi:hypothetical protein